MSAGKNRKIVVGLSGGLDSSMALFLLKKEGWDPVGVTLKLPVWQSEENILRENIYSAEKSQNLARKICQKLDVPYFVVDAREEFKREVIGYFVKEKKEGRTPNPCVVCNRRHKFPSLLRVAGSKGIKFVATGHYAAKKKGREGFLLLRPKDLEKDQTYYLSYLSQKKLARIKFPLGKVTKKRLRKLAKKEGFYKLASKRESQNLCFVAGKSLPAFLREKIGERPGNIVTEEGEVLGEHPGLIFYTLGQRQGLGLSGGPFYVKEKREEENELIVTKKRKELFKKVIKVGDINWISSKAPSFPASFKAKIRYRGGLSSCKVESLEEVKVTFKKPQFAPAPGQFCVFYKKRVCLGGGVIKK